ncbi:MAG: hypothetical protein H6968_04920 [Chromatiaceae bacterium]|nr:hypothetical protein [Chromatiaceae bacterium]
MEMLLTVIVTWLSINFALPATYEHPQVKFSDRVQMLAVRIAALPDKEARQAAAQGLFDGHNFHALYDDASNTIHLSEKWSATSPADVSVLVHEMVHHLQSAGGIIDECAEARERLAYRAQARWLELLGTTLEAEFKVDPMTVFVRTNCWY